MSARGMVIHPDGSCEYRQIHDYKDIIDAVGGDFDWGTPSRVTFYCYEWANYELVNNPVATELYHVMVPRVKELGHPLHGDVLVTGAPVGGDDTDVPAGFIKLYERIRASLGQEEIDRRAVMMSADEVTRQKAEQDQLWAGVSEKLRVGGAVDVGGLIVTRIPDEEEP